MHARSQTRAKAVGIAVHLLTASGAVLGLAGLHAAAQHDWNTAFFWLGCAFVVDGIDGPVARRVKAAETLPRFSGVRLDLIVDYMSYCIVPAFIVMESGLLTPPWGALAAGFMLVTSLFHFCDRKSKTDDGFFVGFPAIWNVVCLYFFVLGAGPAAVSISIATFGVATFVPIKWPHPLRAHLLRPLTLSVFMAWLLAAGGALLLDFPSPPAVQIIFAVTAAYVIALGLLRSFRPRIDKMKGRR